MAWIESCNHGMAAICGFQAHLWHAPNPQGNQLPDSGLCGGIRLWLFMQGELDIHGPKLRSPHQRSASCSVELLPTVAWNPQKKGYQGHHRNHRNNYQNAYSTWWHCCLIKYIIYIIIFSVLSCTLAVVAGIVSYCYLFWSWRKIGS